MTFHSYQSTFHQMAKFNVLLVLIIANNSFIYKNFKIIYTIETGLL